MCPTGIYINSYWIYIVSDCDFFNIVSRCGLHCFPLWFTRIPTGVYIGPHADLHWGVHCIPLGFILLPTGVYIGTIGVNSDTHWVYVVSAGVYIVYPLGLTLFFTGVCIGSR